MQVYQALRWQTPAEAQKDLRREAVAFSAEVRASCRIAAPNDVVAPPAAPSGAADCVQHAYQSQRQTWLSRLRGAALEEADHPLEQQVALQRMLQELGVLPRASTIDGVYGSETRAAIVAFQTVAGLPPTGLLDDASAQTITKQANSLAPKTTDMPTKPLPVKAAPTLWEQFVAESLSEGVSARISDNGPCAVTLELRDADSLDRSIAQDPPATQGPQPLAGRIALLSTRIAAHAVRAVYSLEPPRDRCSFRAVVQEPDIYGQENDRPLFGFEFDRATAERIVWDRFAPENLPRVAPEFSLSHDVERQLNPPPPAPLPAPKPVEPAAKPIPIEHVLFEWNGNSTMTTRPFHVDGPWEVQWSSDGSFYTMLHRVGGDSDIVASSSQSARSSAYQPSGGDFYLDVNGSAAWHIAIVALGASP